MTPDKYVVTAREFPAYGMAYDVRRAGAKWAIAMVATQEQARLVAAAFTHASAVACATVDAKIDEAFRALEVERGEDLYRDRALRGQS